MVKILIVYYSLGGNTKVAAEEVAEGCRQQEANVIVKIGTEATEKDLIECDGIVIGSPDYFSYMAGGLKDFFDRTFYPSQGKVTGKPCVMFVTHGGGGKAVDSLESMCKWFKFKKVAEPLLIKNRPSPSDKIKLRELGALLVSAIKK
ncbi:MAG TPA: NAD(P)H-dependent oxidoreductase [bacterium]|nr:NAD(P)H-dependent oxidoreductase [bacterium]HPO52427.1 NAD(P)H-dependent oxidoreductase [bacterium]HPP08946.1 NAD(P)H-dependent oxidoreductase [bacterium]